MNESVVHQEKTQEIPHIHNTIFNASIFFGYFLDRWIILIAILIEED